MQVKFHRGTIPHAKPDTEKASGPPAVRARQLTFQDYPVFWRAMPAFCCSAALGTASPADRILLNVYGHPEKTNFLGLAIHGSHPFGAFARVVKNLSETDFNGRRSARSAPGRIARCKNFSRKFFFLRDNPPSQSACGQNLQKKASNLAK